jgi:hypothetical protein
MEKSFIATCRSKLCTSCLYIFLFSMNLEAWSLSLKMTSIIHRRWFPRSKNRLFSSGSSISKSQTQTSFLTLTNAPQFKNSPPEREGKLCFKMSSACRCTLLWKFMLEDTLRMEK